MYLAHVRETRFELRRTVADGETLRCEVLAALDRDVLRGVQFTRSGICLPGELLDLLDSLGLDPDDVERALEPWAPRGWQSPRETGRVWKRTVLTRVEEDAIRSLPAFDRRRLAFLRSGEVNLSRIDEVHPKMFRRLLGRCRDEIEHLFLHMERELPADEIRAYVYAVFNLQRHFVSPAARLLPETVDGQALDDAFLQEFCALQDNARLWSGADEARAHARRYLFMHFDHDFAVTDPFRRIYEQFMNDSRRHRPRHRPVPPDEVRNLFGMTLDEIRPLTRRAFARVFRQKAMAMHPDRGGDHDTFVRLLELYKRIVASKH